MSFFSKFFGRRNRRAALEPLYRAAVAAARDPDWYRDGEVPDTITGRFDMLAAVLSLVLLRLERDGRGGEAALLTELFVADMDGSVRQLGTGDLLVGKRVGKLMGALGGRLAAFRNAGEAGFAAAVTRNVFHDVPPSIAAVRFVSERLERFERALAATPVETVLKGEAPAL